MSVMIKKIILDVYSNPVKMGEKKKDEVHIYIFMHTYSVL